MVEVFHRVIIVGGFGYGARMFSPFYILRPKFIAIGGNHPSSKIGILSRFIAENEDGGRRSIVQARYAGPYIGVPTHGACYWRIIACRIVLYKMD